MMPKKEEEGKNSTTIGMSWCVREELGNYSAMIVMSWCVREAQMV